MSDENHTAWDDAHSLGIALRLAQAQNRELRKALAAIADEWPYHADSTENIRNTAKQALSAIKPNQVEQPCTDGNAPHKRVSRQIKEQSRQQWKPIETAPPMSDK